MQWEQFLPEQVLLCHNFNSRLGCRQKSLLRNSGVGVWGQNLILKNRAGLKGGKGKLSNDRSHFCPPFCGGGPPVTEGATTLLEDFLRGGG